MYKKYCFFVLFCLGLVIAPLHANAKISYGSMAIFGSDAHVGPGENYDSVVVLWGTLDFNGRAKDMVVVGGKVKLRRGAEVTQSLVLMGGSLDQEDGATIAGDTVTVQAPTGLYKAIVLIIPMIAALFVGAWWFITTLLWLCFSWLFGALSLYFLTKTRRRSLWLLDNRKFNSFLWALGVSLAFVPGLIFLIISIIGIVFIPMYLLIFGTAYYLSYILSATWIGTVVGRKLGKNWSWPFALFIGLFLTSLIGTCIPWLGKFILFGISVLASGALWQALFSAKAKLEAK